MIRICARLAILLMLSTAAAPAAPPVVISGRVVGKDGHPVTGARVALYTANAAPCAPPLLATQPLENGSFVVGVAASGRYHLSVTRENYVAVERDLNVPRQGIMALALVMTALPTLRLRLVRPDGTPAPRGSAGIWMLVKRRSDRDFSSGVWAMRPVSADGTVEIQDPPGKSEDDVTRVDVLVRETGIGSARASFEGWPEAPETLKFQTGTAISIRVLDKGGHPVADASIRVNGMDPDLGQRFLQGDIDGIGDADGKVTLPSLLPGKYDISADFGATEGVHRQLITLGDRPAVATITPADRVEPDTNMMECASGGQRHRVSGEMQVAWPAPVRDLRARVVTITQPNTSVILKAGEQP